MSTHAGTPLYMAPELLNNMPYDRSVDVYSCGVTLFNLLSGPGKPPFDSVADIILGKVHWERQSPEAVAHPEIRSLLESLMSPDSTLRPSAAKAMSRLGMMLPD